MKQAQTSRLGEKRVWLKSRTRCKLRINGREAPALDADSFFPAWLAGYSGTVRPLAKSPGQNIFEGRGLVVTNRRAWHSNGCPAGNCQVGSPADWHEGKDGSARAGFRQAAVCASLMPPYRVVAAAKDTPPGEGGPGSGTAVITRPKTQVRHPNMYRVLLLNDDYTPMEFVVSVLRKYFNKGPEEATRIMLHVHQHGVGECGIFTYEIAETKVTQVMDHARKHQHPLQCIMEKK